MHHNIDVFNVFVDELHPRKLNSLLNVLDVRHLSLLKTNMDSGLNDCHMEPENEYNTKHDHSVKGEEV